MFKFEKKLLAAIILASTYTTTYAAALAAGNSDAIQFAIQAGSIAGPTQACGQDISVFVSRVNEAINKLATSPGDKVMAMNSFQGILQQAQTQQMRTHHFACSQVIQDFNNLPILRPDYESTVIAQMAPGMTGPANTTAQPPTQPPAATTAPMPNAPAQPVQQMVTNPNVQANQNNYYPPATVAPQTPPANNGTQQY